MPPGKTEADVDQGQSWRTGTINKEPDFLEAFSGSYLRHPHWGLSAETKPVQLHLSYILFPTAQGMILVHQQLAHERIIYERLSDAVRWKTGCYPAQSLSGNLHVIPFRYSPHGRAHSRT